MHHFFIRALGCRRCCSLPITDAVCDSARERRPSFDRCTVRSRRLLPSSHLASSCHLLLSLHLHPLGTVHLVVTLSVLLSWQIPTLTDYSPGKALLAIDSVRP